MFRNVSVKETKIKTERIFALGFSFIIILVFLLSCLTACFDSDSGNKFDNKYHAIIYDKAIEHNATWFTEEYLNENKIRGSLAEGIDFDAPYPYEITNAVTTCEEFDRAFVEFPVDVDFEKEILIVYFFKSYHAIYVDGVKKFRFLFNEITLSDNNLNIGIYSERVEKRKPWQAPILTQ